ncbi:hypothetical protein QIR05_gp4 [ssRNA phage Gephyllon.4_18]|uniref:Uncharacterized protein n=2 Tax=Leviviricetes TaxID=2842243 RepID=A0A8S5L1U1_9VIRU|nr:hypothetical protein QIR05_gp4 [ssRNA phage Gephyllon.4_18]QDH91401.1 MAG: hypothetical protein H4BulkLitter24242_000001 [Leviviridae sp.]DAD51325.1 TPA_asm: hypothetical protein [ssRNA phage Gephyllon.4_18]
MTRKDKAIVDNALTKARAKMGERLELTEYGSKTNTVQEAEELLRLMSAIDSILADVSYL